MGFHPQQRLSGLGHSLGKISEISLAGGKANLGLLGDELCSLPGAGLSNSEHQARFCFLFYPVYLSVESF